MSLLDQKLAELRNPKPSTSDVKKASLSVASEEKKNALDPSWRQVGADQFTDVDPDTARLTGEEFKRRLSVGSEAGEYSPDAFETSAFRYENNPELERRHKEQYARLRGMDAEDVTREDLFREGRAQEQRKEEFFGEGPRYIRDVGDTDIYGRRPTEVLNQEGQNYGQFMSGLEQNANFFSPRNRQAQLEALRRGDIARLTTDNRERGWWESAADLGKRAALGGAEMLSGFGLEASQFIDKVVNPVSWYRMATGRESVGSELNRRLGTSQAIADIIESGRKRFLSAPEQREQEMFERRLAEREADTPFKIEQYKQEGYSDLQAEALAERDHFLDTAADLWNNPGRALSIGAESASNFLSMAGIGRAAFRAAANAMARQAGKSVDEILKDPAALKRLNRITVASGITGGAVMEGFAAGTEMRNRVLDMDTAELRAQSPLFNSYLEQGLSEQEAQGKVADQSAMMMSGLMMGLTGVTGAVTGAGAFNSKLFTSQINKRLTDLGLPRNLMRGTGRMTGDALKETAQEILESGGEQVAANLTERVTLGDEGSLISGTGSMGAIGGAAGGTIGGVAAGTREAVQGVGRGVRRATGTGVDEVIASLSGTESGGRFDAQNNEVGAGGRRGHYGRLQFGHARLDEARRGLGQDFSVEEFLGNPELQQQVERWHINDIDKFIKRNELDKYVGERIGGVKVTLNGMRAAAHLGGKGGLKRFLESSGDYNPSDTYGTSLLNYMRKHGRGGGRLSERGVTKKPVEKRTVTEFVRRAGDRIQKSFESNQTEEQEIKQARTAGKKVKSFQEYENEGVERLRNNFEEAENFRASIKARRIELGTRFRELGSKDSLTEAETSELNSIRDEAKRIKSFEESVNAATVGEEAAAIVGRVKARMGTPEREPPAGAFEGAPPEAEPPTGAGPEGPPQDRPAGAFAQYLDADDGAVILDAAGKGVLTDETLKDLKSIRGIDPDFVKTVEAAQRASKKSLDVANDKFGEISSIKDKQGRNRLGATGHRNKINESIAFALSTGGRQGVGAARNALRSFSTFVDSQRGKEEDARTPKLREQLRNEQELLEDLLTDLSDQYNSMADTINTQRRAEWTGTEEERAKSQTNRDIKQYDPEEDRTTTLKSKPQQQRQTGPKTEGPPPAEEPPESVYEGEPPTDEGPPESVWTGDEGTGETEEATGPTALERLNDALKKKSVDDVPFLEQEWRDLRSQLTKAQLGTLGNHIRNVSSQTVEPVEILGLTPEQVQKLAPDAKIVYKYRIYAGNRAEPVRILAEAYSDKKPPEIHLSADTQAWSDAYKNKAWTNMAELIEDIHGETIRSSAVDLPRDVFKSPKQSAEFLVRHEYGHIVEPGQQEGETLGDYETRINDYALAQMGLPLSREHPQPTDSGKPAYDQYTSTVTVNGEDVNVQSELEGIDNSIADLMAAINCMSK